MDLYGAFEEIKKCTFNDKNLNYQYTGREGKNMFLQLIVLLSSLISLEGAEYCEGIDYHLLDDPTRNANNGK